MKRYITVKYDRSIMTPSECVKIVSDLEQKGLYLNRSGLFLTPQTQKMTEEDIVKNFNVLHKAYKITPFLLITTSKKGLVGSYGLKHTVEKTMQENYISNGDIILVMLCLGYALTKQLFDNSNPNCVFNAKYAKHDFKPEFDRI